MTLNPIKAFNEWQYKRWEPWREYHNKKAEEYENLWFKDAEFDNLGIEHTKEIVQSILWGAKISLSIFENGGTMDMYNDKEIWEKIDCLQKSMERLLNRETVRIQCILLSPTPEIQKSKFYKIIKKTPEHTLKILDSNKIQNVQDKNNFIIADVKRDRMVYSTTYRRQTNSENPYEGKAGSNESESKKLIDRFSKYFEEGKTVK